MTEFDKSKYNEAFIDEAKEQINEMNRLLMLAEKEKADDETLNELFRLIHTLKGTSAILDHNEISEISHLMEDILDKVRNKEMEYDQEMIDVLFESVDRLESMVEQVGTGDEQINSEDILLKLGNLLSQKEKKELEQVDKGQFLSAMEVVSKASDDQYLALRRSLNNKEEIYLISLALDDKCKLVEGRIFQIMRDLKEAGNLVLTYPGMESLERGETRSFQIIYNSKKGEEKIEDMIYQTPEVKSTIFEKIEPDHLNGSKNRGEEKASPSLNVGETIRVNVNILDNLLNLVGESMINNIQINQMAKDLKHKGLVSALKTSNMLTEELQHYVLQVRMVPVDNIFRRFPRMVWDMAKESGKEIQFITEGGDIEIDRGLLDEIGDSLVHLIRNSVDHGIETIEKRKKSGKEPTGSIKLTAHSEHSYIIIEITDDGRGIDVEDITNTAIKANIASEKEISEMGLDDQMALIFKPGLSTAEKVTKVSGRGVGLDVVNNKINSLGGFISIDTEVGKGTKMTIKLPPTMAIIKALLVEIDEERYAIPLENIVETVRIPLEEIHAVSGTSMFKLREEVLPIFFLTEEFRGRKEDNGHDLSAVIVGMDTKVGLVVDGFIGQQEIVVKSIGGELRRSKYFSGATILGDGSVAMIIDVGAFT